MAGYSYPRGIYSLCLTCLLDSLSHPFYFSQIHRQSCNLSVEHSFQQVRLLSKRLPTDGAGHLERLSRLEQMLQSPQHRRMRRIEGRSHLGMIAIDP